MTRKRRPVSAGRCSGRPKATSPSTTTCASASMTAMPSMPASSICRHPGVRDSVAELIRVNPGLEKIVIITEKIAVHDAREIRAMGQANGVDIFGANCLGVADSWSRVRIGGALGGDFPDESLLKGSVAILSNSGGFTATIAQYLATEGWDTTTLISSGKDIYIHYAARDFAHSFQNDDRSEATVLYAEPGGYYEHGLDFGKPVVARVVGRWKSKLTRAVGHAGAMAGSGDRAEDKERWFMDAFGVDGLFTPERSGLLRQRRRGDQHRAHPSGADCRDEAQRHRA
jgi:succinyl-CoA synthetase alpha subunit